MYSELSQHLMIASGLGLNVFIASGILVSLFAVPLAAWFSCIFPRALEIQQEQEMSHCKAVLAA